MKATIEKFPYVPYHWYEAMKEPCLRDVLLFKMYGTSVPVSSENVL